MAGSVASLSRVRKRPAFSSKPAPRRAPVTKAVARLVPFKKRKKSAVEREMVRDRAFHHYLKENMGLMIYLIKENLPKVWIIKDRLQMDEEELHQELAMAMYRGFKTHEKNRTKLSYYLYRCMENKLVDLVRKAARAKAEFRDKMTSSDPQGILMANAADRSNHLKRVALQADMNVLFRRAGLTLREANALIQTYGLFGGKKILQQELAEKEGVAPQQVNRRVQSAFKKLRKNPAWIELFKSLQE